MDSILRSFMTAVISCTVTEYKLCIDTVVLWCKTGSGVTMTRFDEVVVMIPTGPAHVQATTLFHVKHRHNYYRLRDLSR